MVLGKLAKTGTILLSGVLLGSLLNYNSQKTEIVDGINNIKVNLFDRWMLIIKLYLLDNLKSTTSGGLLNLGTFCLPEPSPLVIRIFILFKSKRPLSYLGNQP